MYSSLLKHSPRIADIYTNLSSISSNDVIINRDDLMRLLHIAADTDDIEEIRNQCQHLTNILAEERSENEELRTEILAFPKRV